MIALLRSLTKLPHPPADRILGHEGVVLLTLAVLIDSLNIILTFLDILALAGTIVALILNTSAMIILGGWIWMKTGKFPLKKALLPFGLNSIPIIRVLPFWVISVLQYLEDTSRPQKAPLRMSSPSGAPAPPGPSPKTPAPAGVPFHA